MFRANSKGIQTEFVGEATYPAWQETRSDEQRPDVLYVIVGFVIVHLVLWTEAKAERRVLEKFLTAPGRDVEQTNSSRTNDSLAVCQKRQRFPNVFQDGNTEHEIQ